MSMGWSGTAETAMLENTVHHEWRVYIVVAGTGGETVEITDRLHSIGRIARSTSILDKDWKFDETTITVLNHDAYMTPNRFLISSGMTNIWQERTAGEAEPEDCMLQVDLSVLLPDGSWETKTMFEGKIREINDIHEGELLAVEITAIWSQLDPLDITLTHKDDGDSVSHTVT